MYIHTSSNLQDFRNLESVKAQKGGKLYNKFELNGQHVDGVGEMRLFGI